MRIVFKWIPPSKKNSKTMVCRGRRPILIPSKAYTKWHAEMEGEISLTPLDIWEYIFEYHFYIPLKKDWEKTARPFDYSNKIESINDFLVDIWFIEDDNYNILMPRVTEREFVPYGEWKVILITKKVEWH